MYKGDVCAIIPKKNTKRISNFKRYLNVQGIIQSLSQSDTANSLTKVIGKNFYIFLSFS